MLSALLSAAKGFLPEQYALHRSADYARELSQVDSFSERLTQVH
jgi:hypothetical protein